MGDLPYVKDSGNFGRNSNGKVRFGFFLPEYSESPLEVVQLFRSQYSDRNSTFHFDKPVHCPTSLHLCREFGKGIKIGKSQSSWFAQLNRKMSFHSPRIFALVSA